MELFARRNRAGSSSAEMQTTGSRVLPKTRYRIVVMGAAAVGKTCIVSRLLYHKFLTEYKATVEELHSGQYEVNGLPLTLDILDTSGLYQFPAMRRLSIATGDAFILVYSVDDQTSFVEVERLRDEILAEKTKDLSSSCAAAAAERKSLVPLVVVGNKTDLNIQESETMELESSKGKDRAAQRRRSSLLSATAETTASIDWGHGYVEVSAKEDINISGIFKALLAQLDLRIVPDDNPNADVKEQRATRYFAQKAKHSNTAKRRNSCQVS